MTEREVIQGLLEGLRRCAFCREPATTRGRTLAERGLPACDDHADRLRDRRELAWAAAVRAARATE
jgi:hypothetical protein